MLESASDGHLAQFDSSLLAMSIKVQSCSKSPDQSHMRHESAKIACAGVVANDDRAVRHIVVLNAEGSSPCRCSSR
jgi:hypothetical protein